MVTQIVVVARKHCRRHRNDQSTSNLASLPKPETSEQDSENQGQIYFWNQPHRLPDDAEIQPIVRCGIQAEEEGGTEHEKLPGSIRLHAVAPVRVTQKSNQQQHPNHIRP